MTDEQHCEIMEAELNSIGDQIQILVKRMIYLSKTIYQLRNGELNLTYINPAFLHTKIEEMEITVRLYNILRDARILTVADIIQHSKKYYLGLANSGKKSVAELESFLWETYKIKLPT